MLSKHAGQSLDGNDADFGTDELNGCHEWKGDQCGPERREAEGCAGNGISADAGRIVVGSSRDEPRTNPLNGAA